MGAGAYLYNEDQPLYAETCLPLLTLGKSSVLLNSWIATTALGGYQLDLHIYPNVLRRVLIVVKSYTGAPTSHFN